MHFRLSCKVVPTGHKGGMIMKRFLTYVLIVIVTGFSNVVFVEATNDIIKTETKDKVIFINGSEGRFNYSWTFDKKEYQANAFDFDLGIKFKTSRKHDINNLIGLNVKKKFISFNYHGNLPGTAQIKVPVSDSFKDGKVLKLYYYNEDGNKADLVDSKIKVVNGYVTFDISHCSDYVLTLSIVKEAGEKGNSGVVIIGMIIIIVGLVGYTVFKNRK